MKTKEEILKELGFNATQEQVNGGFIFDQRAYDFTLMAMQLYSDQQNKELKEKLEQYKTGVPIISGNYKEQIQRLTKEVEELKEKVELRTGELVVKVDELTRLRELLERAEPQLNNFVIEMLPVEMESTKQLLKDIDNALNHKP